MSPDDVQTTSAQVDDAVPMVEAEFSAQPAASPGAVAAAPEADFAPAPAPAHAASPEPQPQPEPQLIEPAPAPAPVNAPGRQEMPVEGRKDSDVVTGANQFISWGARSDVGLVRAHNEDSFLLRAPVFAVCDGMGGHAAGEVASAIAVDTIGRVAPGVADDVLLGAAVESANTAVIEGAQKGIGKPGMGCTASCILIEKNKMAVAHVGDSRVYLLRHGTLVRVTHDHSYVEELVDSGQITADEARVHPSRSIITRALGSDPDMYADHFSLDVYRGDRIIVCSDGLSSMIPDSQIERVAVSAATPQQAADNLVAAALTAGGADNVTVLVIDVTDDGIASANRKRLLRHAGIVGGILAGVLAVTLVFIAFFINGEYYLAPNGDTVGIYQGIQGDFLGISMSTLVEETAVRVSDLPDAVQNQLASGIRVASEEVARETVDDYRQQIDTQKYQAGLLAEDVSAGTTDATASSGETSGETGAATGDAAATATPTTQPSEQNGGE